VELIRRQTEENESRPMRSARIGRFRFLWWLCFCIPQQFNG
jgi:hypothetical protein